MNYIFKLSDGNFQEINNRKMISELNTIKLKPCKSFYLKSVGLAVKVLSINKHASECMLTHANDIKERDLL